MRILIVQPRLSYYIGGGEIIPLQQAKYLSLLGHEITLLTREVPQYSVVYKEFLHSKPANIAIFYVRLNENYDTILSQDPGMNWLRWHSESVVFGQAVQKFYIQNKSLYDLVITHMSTDSLFVPVDLKNILHLHGNPKEFSEINKLALLRPDLLCSHSESIYQAWQTINTLDKPMRVTTNGIDTNLFSPNTYMKKDIDVLFVGRFIENKGISELLDATNKVGKVVFVGAGPLRSQIENRKSTQTNIEIVADISTDDLVNYYRRSKVFVCPSRAKEGVLTTMLEAAACQVAIITTNIAGMKDFAKHEQNCLLVEPENSFELSHAIAKLLLDDPLRLKIALNARSDVLANWTWEIRAKELQSIYESIL